ncbi:hypothetical protein D3C86_1571080 [compost metagenome]
MPRHDDAAGTAIARRRDIDRRCIADNAGTLTGVRDYLTAGDRGLCDIAQLDVAHLSIRHCLVALSQGDTGTTEGPALWRSVGLSCLGTASALPAQAEQTVLAGWQVEARQCQGVDLLLGQVGR